MSIYGEITINPRLEQIKTIMSKGAQSWESVRGKIQFECQFPHTNR